MKKIISLILALALVMSLSVTAFAAEGSDTDNKNGDTATVTVSGKYSGGTAAAEVVSVDVAWGAMAKSGTLPSIRLLRMALLPGPLLATPSL